jgi:hypothetical protein
MQPRIFISSTFTDLKEHRKALFAVIDKESGKAQAMELFGSRPGAPKEECLGEVRKAHVFVLILGMRYGSVDADSGLSFTHLEYIEAQRLSLPSLIYLIDESRHLVLPKDVEVGESATKLKKLKEAVSASHVVSLFFSPDDLKEKFLGDLAGLFQREKLGLESRELEVLVSKLPRVTWLNDDRLDFLIKQLGDLSSHYARRAVIKEVLEFLLVGDRQSAVFLTAKHADLDIRKSIDLCLAIEKKLAEIVALGRQKLRKEKQANKSSDSTASAGTLAAGQPRVPASAASHL